MLWRWVVVGILVTPGVSAAANLCPAPSGEADPLEILETQLTVERYRQAMDFLHRGLEEALKAHSSIAQLEDDTHFWIEHANSLRAIEGYVLRQRALHEGGSAVDRLCEFLAKSNWSD